MEFEDKPDDAPVNPTEQPAEELIRVTQETTEFARERGSFAAGIVAVESVMQAPEIAVTSIAEVKEGLAEPLASSVKGYRAIIETLNAGRDQKDVLPIASDEIIAAELETWITKDKIAYLGAVIEADPEVRFTLVATPNVLVDSKDLIKVAQAFGDAQSQSTYVWPPLYDMYTPKELSGTNPNNGNSVVFSLIPSKDTSEIAGTAMEQRAKLALLQANNPDLKVPSPLEAVTYWQTLWAQRQQLTGDTTFQLTHIRHFNLPEKPFNDHQFVPLSGVQDNGKAGLNVLEARFNCDTARVSLG
jgi:hypothetical protein